MDRVERGRALLKKLKEERAIREKEALQRKKELEEIDRQIKKEKQARQKKKKLKLKPKQKPELFRDSFQQISMSGEYIPPEFRFNTPAYDIASGRYINQNQNNVKCWTKYNKSGNPYRTCYNKDYSQQLRRGQPPKATKMRTWLGRTGEIQLNEKKIRLKPINREPDLNYTLL